MERSEGDELGDESRGKRELGRGWMKGEWKAKLGGGIWLEVGDDRFVIFFLAFTYRRVLAMAIFS
jgi:hypothetical protein